MARVVLLLVDDKGVLGFFLLLGVVRLSNEIVLRFSFPVLGALVQGVLGIGDNNAYNTAS